MAAKQTKQGNAVTINDDDESPEAQNESLKLGASSSDNMSLGERYEAPEGKQYTRNRAFVDETSTMRKDDEATGLLDLRAEAKKLKHKDGKVIAGAVRTRGKETRISLVTDDGRKFARRA